MPKHGLPIFQHSSWKEASQGWLRDDERTNTTILSYLKSENEYTNAITSHLTELQDTLYNEMLSSYRSREILGATDRTSRQSIDYCDNECVSKL